MGRMTKAEMLKNLANLPEINVLPVYVVHSKDYFLGKNSEISKIQEYMVGNYYLAVRSSSSMEDGEKSSNAGKFESVLHVDIASAPAIKNAIEKVYASYDTSSDEEILVQPMLHNIKKSGVIFTCDMDTYADYYVANYKEGDDSAAVTAGKDNDLKTFVVYKKSPVAIKDVDMANLVAACRRIEEYLGNSSLDIEFAIDELGKVYIFQVRPIAKGNKAEAVPLDLKSVLKKIYKKVEKLNKKRPFLLGRRTLFGVMPDWNPAEILGIRPKKLAITLYKELITDNIWAHQRADYGYRDLSMHPLMVLFCGMPFIDTRITFNSFVPKKLNTRIADKLINYYINKLAEYPSYHDKVEFNIVFSCYYFGLSDRLIELKNYDFNDNELKRIEFSLLELTNSIISPHDGLYKRDIEKAEILNRNYEKIISSDISTIDKIYWLMEECKEYGTLPFAGAARAGFIAVQFLRSFVTAGIITKEEYDAFMNSLNTISKQISRDVRRLGEGEISAEEFLDLYGHVRPGTYDIMSPSYRENFAAYFSEQRATVTENGGSEFVFSADQMWEINRQLAENGLEIGADDLLLFFKEAIEGREYVKFIFTKAVSKILELIAALGKRLDISRADMAYLDIHIIKQLYSDLYYADLQDVFLQNIEMNKRQYEYTRQIKLPSIILSPDDVYQHFLLDDEPNFIGQKSVVADVAVFSDDRQQYEGKIVCIRAADPGYDFLFAKNIAGLITEFGGANSHMAIRCAELGIPAIIGVGEKKYKKWSGMSRLCIDCLKKSVVGY